MTVPTSIDINDMLFVPREDCAYQNDYVDIGYRIAKGELPELDTYRELIKTDLFFIVFFILRMKEGENAIANHPFVVDACREAQELREKSDARLFLWAREHFKSSIITTAGTIQDIANDPEITIGIFSYSREAATVFCRQLRTIFETSLLLQACFPEIFWSNPSKDAPLWSEKAFTVRRKNTPKEATVEAWGLIDGMPTGRHFMHRVYDDVETEDLVNTPELIAKVISSFDLSENLGTNHGSQEVIGTHYHHEGLLNVLRNRVDAETGESLYDVSLKPATHDGTPTGKPVFLAEKKLRRLKASKYHFYCQQLLDPTPQGERKLEPDMLHEVDPAEIPERVHRFMVIDGAGSTGVRADKRKKADRWGIVVVGVDPKYDDAGLSRVYILDMVLKEMNLPQAMEAAVDLYCRQPRIWKLGVEKVSMSTTEIHVANALRARGKFVSVDHGNLEIVSPKGRSKAAKIEAALMWPFQQGQIFISTAIPQEYRDTLREEMRRFPFAGKDDGLDALSYVYDLLTPQMFSQMQKAQPEKEESIWDRYRRRGKRSGETAGWMAA